MRGRSLVVMAALVLALGAFIWFYERELPDTAEREIHAKRVFGDLEPPDVRELAIAQGGRNVRLVREAPVEGDDGEEDDDDLDLGAPAAEWRVTAPFAARADRFAVDGLVSTLLGIEKGRTLEGIDRAAHGLAPPAATVSLTTEEGKRTLEVGSEVPGSDQRVVALAGGTEGWAVSGAFWGEMTKPAADWRSKELFPGQREEVERIALREGGRNVLLARRGEEFWVEAPIADLADPDRVEELLGALTGLQASEFLEAPPADAGLDPPQAVVEVVRKGRPEPFRVALGAPRPAAPETEATPTEEIASHAAPPPVAGPLRPARVGTQLVTVAAEPLAEAAARPAEQWRSRAWTPIAVYEIDRVELTDGQGTVTLVRDETDWKRSLTAKPGTPAPPQGNETKIFYGPVSDLLAAVTEARAERVLGAEAAREAPGGAPAFTVKLTAGEGEEKREQTLTLSGPMAGGVAARASDRQAVLVLPAALLADLRGKVEAVRKAEPLREEGEAPSPTASPAPG